MMLFIPHPSLPPEGIKEMPAPYLQRQLHRHAIERLPLPPRLRPDKDADGPRYLDSLPTNHPSLPPPPYY